MPGDELSDLAWIEALGECAAHVQELPQLTGQSLAAAEQAGRFDRRGGLVGQDRQQPLIALVELAQAQLGQRDDADDPFVIAHRHAQHGLVDLVRAGDRQAARVGVRIVDEQRRPVRRDPAGEAHPDGRPEQFEIDLVVRPEPALEGDRDELVRLHQLIHPTVVVVDDPADLFDDRPANRLDGVLPAHPGGGGLQDAELGRSSLRLGEQVGVVDGDGGMRADRRSERDVCGCPVARSDREGGERPDHAFSADEWNRQVGAEPQHTGIRVARIEFVGTGRDVVAHERPAGPEHLAQPVLVNPQCRQPGGQGIVDPGPGSDGRTVALDDPDGRPVDAQHPGHLGHHRAQDRRPIEGRGQLLGDLQGRLQAVVEARSAGRVVGCFAGHVVGHGLSLRSGQRAGPSPSLVQRGMHRAHRLTNLSWQTPHRSYRSSAAEVRYPRCDTNRVDHREPG